MNGTPYSPVKKYHPSRSEADQNETVQNQSENKFQSFQGNLCPMRRMIGLGFRRKKVFSIGNSEMR